MQIVSTKDRTLIYTKIVFYSQEREKEKSDLEPAEFPQPTEQK